MFFKAATIFKLLRFGSMVVQKFGPVYEIDLWAKTLLGPVLQRVTIDPKQSQVSNQSQVCSLLSLMYIVVIDIDSL